MTAPVTSTPAGRSRPMTDHTHSHDQIQEPHP